MAKEKLDPIIPGRTSHNKHLYNLQIDPRRHEAGCVPEARMIKSKQTQSILISVPISQQKFWNRTSVLRETQTLKSLAYGVSGVIVGHGAVNLCGLSRLKLQSR